MTKLNILKDSFIYNTTVTGQRLLSAQEVETIISITGGLVTFSGATISLMLDLGIQTSLESIHYYINPLTTSGVEIQYGRSSGSLTPGALNLDSNSIVVYPTQSGYTYPRFITLKHTRPSGTVSSISGISVFNTDGEIDYGVSGSLDSITIVSNEMSGYSSIREIPIYNDGTIPATIYTTIDTVSNADILIENLDRLQISTTPTGVFYNYNEELQVPDTIPWEWGVFDNSINISSDNYLQLKDPGYNPFIHGNAGTESSFYIQGTSNYGGAQLGIAKDRDGQDVFIGTAENHRLLFINPIKRSIFVSATPSGAPTATAYTCQHGQIWDGGDRVYYMHNNADQTLRYYKISNNTHYVLTTVPFYSRMNVRYEYVYPYVYVIGTTASVGTESTSGKDFWRVNILTLVSEQLSSLTNNLEDVSSVTILDNYLYLMHAYNQEEFKRWNLSLGGWQGIVLPESNYRCYSITADTINKCIYAIGYSTGSNYKFDPENNTYTSLPYITRKLESCLNMNIGVCMQLTTAVNNTVTDYVSTIVVDKINTPTLTGSLSGQWVSPVFKINQEEVYHRLLLDYIKDGASTVKANSSLSVDNFEIRGSDTSPASDNIYENFNDGLDPEIYITNSVNDYSSIEAVNNKLVFDFRYINSTDTPYNSAYTTFGYPLNTIGNMQYKFWWNPLSNRVSAAAEYSSFYIVPYLDSLGTGIYPDRNYNTLVRTSSSAVGLRFGQSTDANGVFTKLQFWNGSAFTSYNIYAVSGVFYEIGMLINWDTGAYKIYFDGSLLGSGTIPLLNRNLLKTQHSYEIFSASTGVSATEQFKYLTINRIGTTSSDITDIAIPLHRDDPLYGTLGTLPWLPITVNTTSLPAYKYIQARITLKALPGGTYLTPTVKGIKFPVILKLEDVPVSGTKSVYVRYNFPASNNKETDTIYLKSWMSTDKQ